MSWSRKRTISPAEIEKRPRHVQDDSRLFSRIVAMNDDELDRLLTEHILYPDSILLGIVLKAGRLPYVVFKHKPSIDNIGVLLMTTDLRLYTLMLNRFLERGDKFDMFEDMANQFHGFDLIGLYTILKRYGQTNVDTDHLMFEFCIERDDIMIGYLLTAGMVITNDVYTELVFACNLSACETYLDQIQKWRVAQILMFADKTSSNWRVRSSKL